MGRILSVDYGLARMGLAISDPNKLFALPEATLLSSSNPQQAALILFQYLQKKKLDIECIVIGLPLLLSGKDSEMSEKVKTFATALQEKVPIPIEFLDERFTSALVEKEMRDNQIRRKKRAQQKDEAAACRILTDYLSKIR